MLVTDHQQDALSFRNPSGHTPDAVTATLSMETFDGFTASHGVSLHL